MRSRRPSILQSAALRGALWITLIALLTTLIALTLQYVQTTRVLEARMHASVDDEAAGLIERYQSQGLQGVALAIHREQSLPRLNEFFYLLADTDGTPIVGNLASWPGEVEEAGYHSFRTEVVSTRGATRQRGVQARAVILPGGFRLLVGTLSDERSVLREQYIYALIWALGVTGTLGLFFGFWYSRRALVFVQEASDAGEGFLAGRLGERLPISGRQDEYDRLGETINSFFDEIERLLGSLRAATDGLAHDLKTPLTRMKSRLELSEFERKDAESLRNTIVENRQDVESLMSLIDGVLGLARVEAVSAATFAPVRLDTIVHEAIELFQPLAEDKTMRFDVETEPLIIPGARSLLAQMITNLIDNAIKYNPAGGSVSVLLKMENNQAKLVVADRGPGIPESQYELALTRFGRLDPSRSEPGTGIGLSIVAAAARVHRARLNLADNFPGLRVEVVFDEARSVSLDGSDRSVV